MELIPEDIKYQQYLPEREPKPGEYKKFDEIQIVHFSLEGEGGNEREEVVRQRLKKLKKAGIEIKEVDIDTPGNFIGLKVVVGGSLGDTCALKRRRFIIDNGGRAIVDSALTSDY